MSPKAVISPEYRQMGQIPAVLPGVIGNSAALQAAANRVSLIAGTDVTCLLSGETGTGKELFARAIHYMSSRRNGPFVPLNCGAVPDQLFENELFGHVRGAYTDARSSERGLLGHAEGGTLFLDEVDSLSVGGQVKLLRVLQEREYRPMGSSRTVPANIRIVAATNSDLSRKVHDRGFREDLYFRLNVLSLTIPPLRERLDDIPALLAHFIREYSAVHGRAPFSVERSALDRLLRYRWPGNVRELQAVVQRAVLTATTPSISSSDFELPDGVPPAAQGHMTLQAARSVAVTQCERSYLSTVLRRCEGNVTQAARLAGKERRSFQRLLRKHSIAVIPFKNGHELT